MKKVISVLLAVILAFSALSVAVFAQGDNQTYYITYEVNEENIQIVPVDGYNQYVRPGDDFKFRVKVTDGRSDVLVIVQVDMVTIEPDVHGIYTIEEIYEEHTVKAFFSLEEGQANIFASLIVMLRQLFQQLVDMLDALFRSSQT